MTFCCCYKYLNSALLTTLNNRSEMLEEIGLWVVQLVWTQCQYTAHLLMILYVCHFKLFFVYGHLDIATM